MIGSKLFFHMPTLEFSFGKGMQHQDSSCKNNRVVMHFKLYLFFFMQFNLLYRFKLHCGTKKNIMMRKKLTFNSKEQKLCKKNSFAWYLIHLEKSKHSFLKTKAKSPIISSFTTTVYILTRDDIVKKVTQHKSLLKLGQLKPWGVKQGHSFMLCMGEKRRK